jgi:DNA polymerase III alpha subunit
VLGNSANVVSVANFVAFADLPEACDTTVEIARRCAFLVPTRET